MPLLDVSFMCEDPMLADTFDVRRRLNVMGVDGRVTATAGQLFVGVVGVVTQQGVATLMRMEDGQSVPKRIFIASRFQFITESLGSPGNQPDEITWNGILYYVEESLPYSRYGAGFYECIAQFRGVVPPTQ